MSLDELALETRIVMFVHLSQIGTPPFSFKRVGADYQLVARRICYGHCSALSRTNRKWNFAWRTFIVTYVFNHLAAIIRGLELRNYIARRTDFECAPSTTALNDHCTAARRAGLPTTSTRESDVVKYSDAHCIAEALRYATLTTYYKLTRAELSYYRAAGLFDSHCIVVPLFSMIERTSTVNVATHGRSFFANGQWPTEAFVARLSRPLLRWHSQQERVEYSEILSQVRRECGELALRDWNTTLHLPTSLFARELLQHSLCECVSNQSYLPLVNVAIRDAFGSPADLRRTEAFVLAYRLLHIFFTSQCNFAVDEYDDHTFASVSHNMRLGEHLESLFHSAAGVGLHFGIKLSDCGIVSAADTILHCAIADSLGIGGADVLNEYATSCARMLYADCDWVHAASAHQNLVELHDSVLQRSVPIADAKFLASHLGAQAVWQFLDRDLADASQATLNVADQPPISIVRKVRRGMTVITLSAPSSRRRRRPLEKRLLENTYEMRSKAEPPCAGLTILGTLAVNRVGCDATSGIEYVILWAPDAQRSYGATSFAAAVANMHGERRFYRPVSQRFVELINMIGSVASVSERTALVRHIFKTDISCAHCNRPVESCQPCWCKKRLCGDATIGAGLPREEKRKRKRKIE